MVGHTVESIDTGICFSGADLQENMYFVCSSDSSENSYFPAIND